MATIYQAQAWITGADNGSAQGLVGLRPGSVTASPLRSVPARVPSVIQRQRSGGRDLGVGTVGQSPVRAATGAGQLAA